MPIALSDCLLASPRSPNVTSQHPRQFCERHCRPLISARLDHMMKLLNTSQTSQTIMLTTHNTQHRGLTLYKHSTTRYTKFPKAKLNFSNPNAIPQFMNTAPNTKLHLPTPQPSYTYRDTTTTNQLLQLLLYHNNNNQLLKSVNLFCM